MCCSTTTTITKLTSSSSLLNYNNSASSSNEGDSTILVDMSYHIKPLNLQGGQCSWCGKYGHKRPSCPLLK